MKFNDRSTLRGQHAFLSPSKYHWVNYSDDKLVQTYSNYFAVQRGTILHDLAAQLIEMRVKLPPLPEALNLFVNDAIAYRMIPEQPLFYSENAFGTADAIKFEDNLLRIHDLKTGVTAVKAIQLEVYAALFCLEYDYSPLEIDIELRIYQGDGFVTHIPEPERIIDIMHKIVEFDVLINKLREELE